EGVVDQEPPDRATQVRRRVTAGVGGGRRRGRAARFGHEAAAVTFLIFDGHQSLDLVGPFEVLRDAGYACTVAAGGAGLVRSSMGLSINADAPVSAVDPRGADAVIVAGGGAHRGLRPDAHGLA